jgi:hypothetical protein
MVVEWFYLSTISSQQREKLRKDALLEVCNEGAVFGVFLVLNFALFGKK